MTPNTNLSSAQPDYLSPEFLMGSVGAPFIIGLAVGYFAKKMLRTALFLGGALIVALFVAEAAGIAKVSDSGLQDAANTAGEMAKTSGSFLMDRLALIQDKAAKGVSAGAGFLAGLRMG